MDTNTEAEGISATTSSTTDPVTESSKPTETVAATTSSTDDSVTEPSQPTGTVAAEGSAIMPTDSDSIQEHNHDSAANAAVDNEKIDPDMFEAASAINHSDEKTEGVVPEPEDSACPRDTGFTSEKFKIEISELPKKFGFGELKKRLSVTLGLKPHKLKALPRKSFAFVCFSSEEDKEQALRAINGHVWKGRTLRAKKALPAADPMKRKHEESGEDGDKAKKARLDSSLPPAIRLRSCVEPLWDIPYEEQLKRKTDKAKEALRAVAFHGDVRVQFMKARKENDGMCCPLETIIPSPVMEGYRNKSEFSVGRSEDRSEVVVGFRFGLYKDGTASVGSPSQISIISPHSKTVVEGSDEQRVDWFSRMIGDNLYLSTHSFEKYVRQSQYTPFDHCTHCGHWRQLMVRTARAGGGTMAVAEFVVNNTTQDQMAAEKESIKNYFTEGEGKAANVSTFFFRPCSAQTSNSTSQEPYELIYGDGHVFETMMDLKFRISPSAFFQVNTAAAEVLYKLISDWCKTSPTTTILDICCGTGTIGQAMAKGVSRVIGVEMCKEAIEDAKINASLNGVENVDYHCAKVEQVISEIVRGVSGDCVAVLDPPRGGVHTSVIKSLRSCRGLKRIVYAACNPAGAKHNFIDLCRPESKKTRGEPFKFVRAVPIDMFPCTMHFELLVLFERELSERKSHGSESD